jgi:hypothetical protein
MAWIRRALQTPYCGSTVWQCCFRNQAPSVQSQRLRNVAYLWVTKQKDWFRKQARSHHSDAATLRLGGFGLAFVAWVIAFLMFWLRAEWLVIWCSGFILSGGLLIAYCERQSHEELARQYERMKKTFELGEQEINDWLSKDKIQEAQNVLRVVGEEALTENTRWLILRRSRPWCIGIMLAMAFALRGLRSTWRNGAGNVPFCFRPVGSDSHQFVIFNLISQFESLLRGLKMLVNFATFGCDRSRFIDRSGKIPYRQCRWLRSSRRHRSRWDDRTPPAPDLHRRSGHVPTRGQFYRS